MDEELLPCPNYELCQNVCPQWIFDIKNGTCLTCDIFGWKKLIFINNNDDCIVCYENNCKKIMFPTNCGHSVCINCFKKLFYGKNEHEYELSPTSYGCPPCPNNCFKPIKGIQEWCDECDELFENWCINSKNEYNKWYYDNNILIDNEISENYIDNRCPICRSTHIAYWIKNKKNK